MGIFPSYKVTFETENGYEDLFKNMTLKTNKQFVYSELKRMEKEADSPAKRLKLTGLKKLYAKTEKVNRNKIIAAALLSIVGGAFAAGTLAYALDNAVNEERDYARSKGLSEDLVKRIQDADDNKVLDAGEKTLIDYLATLDKPSQLKVANAFLSDNILSTGEAYQIRFLESLPKDVHKRMLDSGEFANDNMDGDSWSNYFEHFVSKTPYDAKNDIYVIMMTQAGREYPPVKEMFDILEKAKIPEDHVYDLALENNNSAEFKKACESIAQVSDKNDTVLFVINGHGNNGEFSFRGVVENGVWRPLEFKRYTWFRDVTNNIISQNKVFIIDSCYSGSAIKDLAGENKLVLTNATAEQQADFGIEYKFLKAFSNPLADTDKNGYVSIGEAAEYAKMKETFDLRQAQLSDVSNIGKTNYLLEFRLED